MPALVTVELKQSSPESVTFAVVVDSALANDVKRCRHTHKHIGALVTNQMRALLLQRDKQPQESVEAK
jgi:hypothetical protein